MSSSLRNDRPLRVAIIGGGISGLSAAFYLQQRSAGSGGGTTRPLETRIFEAADRVGGALWTTRHDEFVVERGADMFSTQQRWAHDLCQALGLEDELIPTNAEFRRAFVVRGGRLHPVPAGFTLMAPSQYGSILTSSLLSLPGKLRLLREPWISPRRSAEDESIADFARRRLGTEAYEWLVQPLVGGIYTGDAERLSMTATMKQFVEMEREHGSLMRGMRRRRSQQTAQGARYQLFLAPRDGMQRLADALVARLPADCIRTGTAVQRIEQTADGWQVATNAGVEHWDRVLVATSARSAGSLLAAADANLQALLHGIPYASSAVVVLAYHQADLPRPLNAFGLVVPDAERRPILAASFSSVKFENRAPAGHELIRVFLGGAAQPQLLELSDAELRTIARHQLAELVQINAPPLFSEVVRWENAMPQYHLGHVQLVDQINQRLARLPGLDLAGNAYHGVGVPFCVHEGRRFADRVWADIMAGGA